MPTPPPERRIAHLDMDAFFASVELLRYPQLKGLPVVIGGARRAQDPNPDTAPPHTLPVSAFARLGDYVGRGVITTATYAARQFGVGSAMGLMKAAKLCPQAVLLPVDFARYSHYSREFKAAILEIAPVMEDRGIDEVYIDFTQVPGGQREGGRVLARLIQTTIATRTGLSCSVGVAPNKLLAKMASEFDKPGGITVLHANEVPTRIWPLACRKINGIGPKTEARLHVLGLATIGELARFDPQRLCAEFGTRTGTWLAQAAQGLDDRPLVTHSEPVSVSRETTFARDLHAVHDRAELSAILTRLCSQVAADLASKGLCGRTVGIKLRYDNFQVLTRDLTLEHAVHEAQALRQAVGQCLKRVPLQRRLRLLGVRVAGLGHLSDTDNYKQNQGIVLINKAYSASLFDSLD
jgi:DNA polymerase-4